MTEGILGRLFEHNNWAHLRIIDGCYALHDEQLDASPHVSTEWTIRSTLLHLVGSQQGHLSLLSLPLNAWVVMLQAINHATEHRRQMARMLTLIRQSFATATEGSS